MVCIIDDREDVWNFAPNLVHVKPYHFFKNTGDINAPPGLSKRENDHDKEKEKKRPEVELGAEDVKTEDSVQAEDSSSEDEPQEESKVERRESIDMPSFDSNSRDRLDEDQNDRAQVKVPEFTSDTSSSKTETKTDKHPVTPTDDVSDDLEISDSDSSSGIKSREISDTEEVPQEKAGKSEDNVKREDSTKDKKRVVDVEDNDDYLLYLEDILRTVHKAYYDLHDQSSSPKASLDLKMVIPYVRKKTLQGVTMVMSGVVPTQVPLERSKPYLLARALGASVKRDVDSSTTHLVAARLGTAKVNDARRQTNVAIVTPDWLWACAERWERVEERLFTLSKTSSVTRRPPAHCSSPEIAFAERCSDLDLNLDGALARQPSVAEADPFLSFSSEDLAGMDKEVEDILSGEESDSEGEEQENCWKREAANDSSSGESMSGDHPRGYKRVREIEGADREEDERGMKDGRKEENSDCEGGSEESGEQRL